jgi:glycosyltransferase involved in cell wall biosynthesis
MKRDIEIDYYQITLGPAHLARIEALNGQPGIRCRGVALAASEETRRYGEGPGSDVETVLEGIYEATPLIRRLYATLAHADARSPDLIIIDAPADPIQFCLGRRAQSRGVRVFSRWAATILDHPRRRAKEFLKGFVYRGWDAYLVTGARGREYLSTFGVSDRDVFVCGNPVDAESIEHICDVLSYETRQDAFLFAGRFLRLKNLPAFARAYLRYRSEGGRFGLRLAGFGEEERAVRAILESEPDVEFLGHLDLRELVRQYRRAAALVLPSYSENWGLVVNEAMHAELPVLVSSHTGCAPELVEDGLTGLVFDPLSEDSMARSLHRFEALGEKERACLAEAASRRVQTQRPERWAELVANAARSRVADEVSSGGAEE